MRNILKGIPKPVLKKATKVLQEILEEKERESSKSTGQLTFDPSSFSRIVHKDIVTLNEIVAWAKSHYPNDDDVKFVVMKDNSDNLDYDFVLYLLYLKDNKPLLGNQTNSMAVYSRKMDDSLKETFNDSDIIEFE